MPTPDQEPVTCPGCGKAFRFKPELAGKRVTCKACGEPFDFPELPKPAAPPPPPADDAGLYELASDPELDDPTPPPAFVPEPTTTPEPTEQAEQVVKPPMEPPATSASDQAQTTPTSSILDAEEPAYVSDAVKAARREEQRIAAMADATEEKWWKQKWFFVVIGLLILFAIIYWAMTQFSDAMDDGLHNTLHYEQGTTFTLTDPKPDEDRL